jgi:hypothetical protein
LNHTVFYLHFIITIVKTCHYKIIQLSVALSTIQCLTIALYIHSTGNSVLHIPLSAMWCPTAAMHVHNPDDSAAFCEHQYHSQPHVALSWQSTPTVQLSTRCIPSISVPLLTTRCLTTAVHTQCPGYSVLHSINTNTINCCRCITAAVHVHS